MILQTGPNGIGTNVNPSLGVGAGWLSHDLIERGEGGLHRGERQGLRFEDAPSLHSRGREGDLNSTWRMADACIGTRLTNAERELGGVPYE